MNIYYGWRPWAPVQRSFVFFASFAMASLIAVAASAQGQELAAFESGSVQDQLQLDITPIPVGMGALFVRSLTMPALEPQVIVYFGDERVAYGRTGERILLPPGEYRVVVGHGQLSERASTSVRVVDGVTTPVAPFFAGLRVTAVNVEGKPVSMRYVLSEGDGGRVWGERRTASSPNYNETTTWLLPPSAAVISVDGGLGEKGAIAVPLTAGQLVRYRLVVDGGRILRGEVAERETVVEERWWRLRWVVGAELGFNRTDGQLGAFNGDSLRVGVFTRALGGVDVDNHVALLNLKVDESWISYESIDGQTLEPTKIADEVLAELLYTYRLGGIIGPYGRVQARTTLFDTVIRPEDGTAVTIQEKGRSDNFVSRGEVKLLEAFEPFELRQGAGIQLALVDNELVTVAFNVGGAARQAWYGDGLYLDRRQGDTLHLVRLADDQSFGAEAGVELGLRLGQTLSIESGGDLYLPSQQMVDANEIKDLNPVFRLESTATLSFNQFLSVVYDLNIRKDAYEIKDAKLSHILGVRLQHTLF